MEALLDIRNVSKSFYRKEALHNVSLAVNKGEIYGLLGPNGAGKTTLIRIINRIIRQDEGVVRFNGAVMTDQDLRKIGYLPEERGLYRSMTVYDHLLFLGRLKGLSKQDTKDKIEFWLNYFKIEDWQKKRIEELSKGMAQKVQFISTVLHEPELLILDEPFSGFDPVNVELIKSTLLDFRRNGKTIILSTHNMRSVEEICDRASLINHSRKIAEGRIADLQEERKAGVYAVKFRGNMIAFVNALWTGFEVIEKEELGGERYVVRVKMRNNSSFEDLLQVLIGQVKIEAAWEVLPSMQDVFIELVQPNESADEK